MTKEYVITATQDARMQICIKASSEEEALQIAIDNQNHSLWELVGYDQYYHDYEIEGVVV